MDVQRIAEGLWRWSAVYEDWGEPVGSVYLETADAVVLVDPFVPDEPGERERFWTALDRDVGRVGAPVHVLLTVLWHTRSAAAVVGRYGARLHVPSGGRAAIDRRTGGAVTDSYRAGDRLPGGVEAHRTARRGELVLWVAAHRALVPGDVLLGGAGGDGLRLAPASWLTSSTTLDDLRASLLPLLELPVERVLVSHGEPVLADGHAALARALAP